MFYKKENLVEIDEEPVCFNPNWHYPSRKAHVLILTGLVISTALIVGPAIVLGVWSAINAPDDYPWSELKYTMLAGAVGEMGTGIAFFCCTRKGKEVHIDEESPLILQTPR